MDEVTPEERQVRLKKADSIRKMLAGQSKVTTSHKIATQYKYSRLVTASSGDAGANTNGGGVRPEVLEAMSQEKKEREHLLALNQVIARQVMEKSRRVAGTTVL
jgi:hypothetical protein